MAEERGRAGRAALTEKVRLALAFAFAALSLALAVGLAVTLDDFLSVDAHVQTIATLDRIDRLQQDVVQRTADEQLAVRAYLDGAPASTLAVYNHARQRVLDDTVALRLSSLEVPSLHDAIGPFLNSHALVETFVNNQVALANGRRLDEAQALAAQGRLLNEAFGRAEVRLDAAIQDLKNHSRNEIATLLTVGRVLSAIAAIANLVAAIAVAFLAYEYTHFRKAAEIDEVTGLHNRRYFEKKLLAAVKMAAQRGAGTFALFYLDLDGFKNVNDTHGHRAGDDLLRAVGQRIQDNVAAGDVVARLGGDEFAVIVFRATESQAASIAQRLSGILAQPYALRRKTLTVGCSLGFSVHPGEAGSASELMQAADSAMYRVKRAKIAVASETLTR